jgi:hypothetical protein
MGRLKQRADRALEMYVPEWDRVQGIVARLDAFVEELERKWGVGRLALLVPDELRSRFETQKERLAAAIRSEKEKFVTTQADGMRRAWSALERAAQDAGEQPLSPLVWECVLPSTGEVVSLVRTLAEAHHIAREGRVFTVGEIATLIAGLGNAVLEVKKHFPGATVIGIRRKPPIDWERGDELPSLEGDDAQHC